MKKILLLLLLAATTTCFQSAAQCDPWITKAYKMLYDRTPTSAECNIQLYNKGKWSNYPELVSYIAGYNNNRSGEHLKGDPWIFMAYAELFDRAPNAFELNIKLYNNGSWNNYDELRNYVRNTQAVFQRVAAVVKQVSDGNGNFLAIIQRAAKTAVSVVSNRGEVKAKGGKAALAAAFDALRKAAKAKGIQLTGNEQGFAPSGKYVTLSGTAELLPTSGNGAIVFE